MNTADIKQYLRWRDRAIAAEEKLSELLRLVEVGIEGGMVNSDDIVSLLGEWQGDREAAT